MVKEKNRGISVSDKFLSLYNDRVKKGISTFSKYYEEVKNGRMAFNQIVPNDIIWKATDLDKKSGNDNQNILRETTSQFLVPLFTAIVKKQIENLSANPWRFEIEGNNKLGVLLKKAIDRELRKVLTTENIMQRLMMGYFHFCVDGVLISQTVSRDASRKLIFKKKDENGKFLTDTYPIGNSIDIVVYDPLGVILDDNCNYSRIRETSNFAITTIGWFSPEYILEKYGVEATNKTETIDLNKRELYGITSDRDDVVPVREYYLNDGYYYTIIGDDIVIDKNPVSNGSADRIPLNVAVQFYNPDCVFGFTPWSIMRESISLASMAINQTIDNNSFNNNSPFITYTGSGLEGQTLAQWEKNGVIEISPIGQKPLPINEIFVKPQINDISQSTAFLYEQALSYIYFLTGSSPASFGIQDKQIRTNDVASIIGNAMVRSDSDIARKIETGFMNPTLWDILQIFKVDYDKFKFKEQEIPETFFNNLKNVRVVNGSYLPEDRINRIGKAAFLKQNALQNPASYKLIDVEKEVLDSAGISDEYVKSDLDVMKERILQMVIASGLNPEGFTPQQQQMIAQLAQIATMGEETDVNPEA